MHKLIAKSAAIVFFAITAIFAVVFYYHWEGSKFLYSKVNVLERPNSKNSTIFIQGIETDAPLKAFASDFNVHISHLNEQRAEEGKLLLLLDFVGGLAALLAGGLELSRPSTPKDI